MISVDLYDGFSEQADLVLHCTYADLIKQSRQGMPDNVILVINVHVFHRGPHGGILRYNCFLSRYQSIATGGGGPDKTPCPPLSVSAYGVSKNCSTKVQITVFQFKI